MLTLSSPKFETLSRPLTVVFCDKIKPSDLMRQNHLRTGSRLTKMRIGVAARVLVVGEQGFMVVTECRMGRMATEEFDSVLGGFGSYHCLEPGMGRTVDSSIQWISARYDSKLLMWIYVLILGASRVKYRLCHHAQSWDSCSIFSYWSLLTFLYPALLLFLVRLFIHSNKMPNSCDSAREEGRGLDNISDLEFRGSVIEARNRVSERIWKEIICSRLGIHWH